MSEWRRNCILAIAARTAACGTVRLQKECGYRIVQETNL